MIQASKSTSILETKNKKDLLGHSCSWWHAPLETLLIVLTAIVFLELFFRLCGVGGQEFLEPDQILGCHQIPNKQVIWRFEGFSNGVLNSQGRRDVEHKLAKPANMTRIAVLGDSATEGLQVSLKNNYCRILESKLNGSDKNAEKKFEVLNFGCSSYSTGQQTLQFEKQVLPYQPDIVVLLYVRGAALQNVYNTYKRAVEPRPYFYLDKNGQLQEDDSILKEQSAALSPNPMMSFLRKHSRIYGIFSQANLSLSIHEPLYNKIRGLVSKLGSLTSKPAYARLLYPPQDAWPVTKALLVRLNNNCQKNNCKLIVMAFPNTVNDPILAKQIPELKQMSKENGFDFLDLTASFKAYPDTQSLFLQYHFSSAGHQLVADKLKDEISAYLTAKSL